jgi:hypothetical protein
MIAVNIYFFSGLLQFNLVVPKRSREVVGDLHNKIQNDTRGFRVLRCISYAVEYT